MLDTPNDPSKVMTFAAMVNKLVAMHLKSWQGQVARGGGLLSSKMHTPARTVPRNPYPHWHKICEPLTLTGTKLWPRFIPLLAQTQQKQYITESFHVKRSNLVEVRARTDPDLSSLVIFYVFQ